MKRELNYYRIRKLRDSAYELCSMCDDILDKYNNNDTSEDVIDKFCSDIMSLHNNFRRKLSLVCKPAKQYTISDEERKRRSENMKIQRTKRTFSHKQ